MAHPDHKAGGLLRPWGREWHRSLRTRLAVATWSRAPAETSNGWPERARISVRPHCRTGKDIQRDAGRFVSGAHEEQEAADIAHFIDELTCRREVEAELVGCFSAKGGLKLGSCGSRLVTSSSSRTKRHRLISRTQKPTRKGRGLSPGFPATPFGGLLRGAPLPEIPGYTWRLPADAKLPDSAKPVLACTTFIVGEKPLTPAAVRLIIKRTAAHRPARRRCRAGQSVRQGVGRGDRGAQHPLIEGRAYARPVCQRRGCGPDRSGTSMDLDLNCLALWSQAGAVVQCNRAHVAYRPRLIDPHSPLKKGRQ